MPSGNRRRLCAGLVALLLLPVPALSDNLPVSVARALARHGIPESAVSIEIRDIENRRPVFSLNGDVPRNPASAIKLVTTLGALQLFGPHHQWETQYYLDGSLKGDALLGNLVLRGGGDPFLTVDRLWHHVMSLRGLGIRDIAGNLVIDNSLYDIPEHDRAAFDNSPNRLYNVGPDAALVNFSATRFVIHPVQGRIAVHAEPPLEGIELTSRLKSQAGECISKKRGWNYRIDRGADTVRVRFEGTYRADCGVHSVSRSVLSNNDYAFRLFRLLWTQSGGTLGGSYRVGRRPDDSVLLSSHRSTPLSDTVTSINKYSNNVMARMLFLNLDTLDENEPATLAGARQRVAEWLADNGIEIPGLHVDNGSGLSRSTRITASGMAELLQLGWESPYSPEFLSSLPLAALDGTMKKRLHDSPIVGRARIKTGSLNGVRSMAGYIIARDGKPYSVTMLMQSDKVTYRNGSEVQDAVLKWINSTIGL